MDKFSESYNLPKIKGRLNNEDTENLNRLITSKGIATVIKHLPTKKTHNQMVSPVNSTKHSRKNTNSSQTLPPKKLKMEHFQIHFTRHYPNTKARHGHYKKRKLQTNIPNKYRCKNPQQNTSKPNSRAH